VVIVPVILGEAYFIIYISQIYNKCLINDVIKDLWPAKVVIKSPRNL